MTGYRLALLAAYASLAGCFNAGPDYHLPDKAMVRAAAANGAFAGANGRGVSKEAAIGPWWRLYKDPELDRLLREALAANTDLRVAAANIGVAQASLARAEDQRLPSTKLDATFGFERLSAEQYLLTEPIPDLGLYDTGLTIGYQIDLFGQIRRGIEAARADDAAAIAAYDLARITVVADTTEAYAQACAAGHELEVAEHTVELQRQSYDLTRRLVGAGRTGISDQTRSAAQLDQFRANVPALLAQQRGALYRLAVLTGKPPAAFPREVEACKREPTIAQLIPVGDGAALLRRRPDIREAERRLAAATARIGVATADLYPKVAFGITAGSTGAIDDFFSSPTLRYGVGPMISWDFLNQTEARAKIATAEAQTSAALARFDGTVLRALREAESAMTIYAHDLDRRAALTSARAQSAQSAADARRLYVAGRDSYLSVLDAERTLAGVDQALAAAESKVALDQINLFLALGGGWEPSEAP